MLCTYIRHLVPIIEFVFFLTMTFTQSQDSLDSQFGSYQLRACVIIENGSDTSFFDYDESVAAIDLAVEFANENILPNYIQLTTSYVKMNSGCSERNHIVAEVMNLWAQGQWCDVYIGPGKCTFSP